MERKVIVYKFKRVADANYREKTVVGPGIFHQFGVDYEELQGGVGNFTTAIVEMPDGSILNIPVGLVVFNN